MKDGMRKVAKEEVRSWHGEGDEPAQPDARLFWPEVSHEQHEQDQAQHRIDGSQRLP